jgi:predicted Zn-dependent protease
MTPRVLLLLGLVTVGCFRTTGLNRFQPNIYSVDHEIGMGREMSTEVEKEVTLVRHHGLGRLVQGIAQRLVEHATRPEFRWYPYTIKVVDSPEVNAFSLPGGPLYLNMGMIELAENEDELAAVIAHEMGHVAARHATERMTTLELSQMAMYVTLAAIGGVSPLALEGTRLGYILGVLQYSRDMESEADELGLALMESAGYDPRGMLGMLGHIEEERREEPVLLERLLSSHPLPDARLQAVESRISGEERAGRHESPSFVRTKILFIKD